MPRGIGPVKGHALLNREGGEAEQAQCMCGAMSGQKLHSGRRISWQREHLHEIRNTVRRDDT